MNKLFNSASAPAIASKPAPAVASAPFAAATVSAIKLEDAKNAVGKTITVSGMVFSSKDIGSMVLVNLGAAYPNQLLTVALKGKAKELGAQLGNITITVSGEVIDYKGKPEIIVTDPANIKF